MKFHALIATGLVALGGLTLQADEAATRDVNWKIRREATENSQIMKTLHVLTDVYGPRVTGSPNLKNAGEWAVKQLESWGLTNGHLEPWDFGKPGWLNERVSAHLVSPVKDSLVGEVLAWTPSTPGPVRAKVVSLVLPERPTEEALTAFFAANAAAVKGMIVLVGKPGVVPVALNPVSKRLDTADARSRFDPENPAPSPFANRTTPTPTPGRLTGAQVAERLDMFLVTNGAVARLNDAGREHGQIRAFNNRTFDLAKAVPTVVLRNEDFGRISRLLADKRPVEVELEVVNQSYPEGTTAYNAVAEIPGGDKAQEVVMLGAHLDSWHAATGATDNGIGSAVMMEAARILKAIGVKPRRTIRLALWGGEEQGLLGSKAYVKAHFGTAEEPTPEHANFAGYINVDTGTGRIRGLTVFGPDQAGAILRGIVAPFADLGVAGAITTKSRRTGGTDHTSFNAAGLPGIGTQLDPMEYQSHTWHTNLDTYERIIEDDVKAQAAVIAAVVYELSMRDEMLPRFTKDEMPKPPDAPAAPAPSPEPAPTTGEAGITGLAAQDAPNTLTAAEKAAGWRLLFDGASPAGWRGYGKSDLTGLRWVVKDGTICLPSADGADTRGHRDIISKDTFGDFDLTWQWQVQPGSNSGVKYFVLEGGTAAIGHEYQIIDDAKHPDAKVSPERQTASFYDVKSATARPTRPVGEWNTSRVVVSGQHVEHWLNGTRVLEYELGTPETLALVQDSKFKATDGFGTKKPGHILLQDHGDAVCYRNIKIKPGTT